jgi:hypothetical protein
MWFPYSENYKSPVEIVVIFKKRSVFKDESSFVSDDESVRISSSLWTVLLIIITISVDDL